MIKFMAKTNSFFLAFLENVSGTTIVVLFARCQVIMRSNVCIIKVTVVVRIHVLHVENEVI